MSDNPRRPKESIITVQPTTTGGERIVIRNESGRLETVVTSPSSIEALNKAVKAYPRTLKNLAKR